MKRGAMRADERVWSVKQRKAALTQLFLEAGFVADDDDWVYETPELRWEAFFNSIPDEHGERHDISYSARLMRPDLLDQWAYLTNDALSDLPSVSRTEYRHVDVAVADPLVLDTRVFLLPLIFRLPTAESIFDALLAGELGRRRAHRIARTWMFATEYGYPEYARHAEALVATGNWTPEDRWQFQNRGMSVEGTVRDPGHRTLLDRMLGRY